MLYILAARKSLHKHNHLDLPQVYKALKASCPNNNMSGTTRTTFACAHYHIRPTPYPSQPYLPSSSRTHHRSRSSADYSAPAVAFALAQQREQERQREQQEQRAQQQQLTRSYCCSDTCCAIAVERYVAQLPATAPEGQPSYENLSRLIKAKDAENVRHFGCKLDRIDDHEERVLPIGREFEGAGGAGGADGEGEGSVSGTSFVTAIARSSAGDSKGDGV